MQNSIFRCTSWLCQLSEEHRHQNGRGQIKDPELEPQDRYEPCVPASWGPWRPPQLPLAPAVRKPCQGTKTLKTWSTLHLPTPRSSSLPDHCDPGLRVPADPPQHLVGAQVLIQSLREHCHFSKTDTDSQETLETSSIRAKARNMELENRCRGTTLPLAATQFFRDSIQGKDLGRSKAIF